MYEVFGFFAFVACFATYGILKALYKYAEDFYYFDNDGDVANWIVDGLFVIGMIALKLVLNPHGDFSPITIVRLALIGYFFSGMFSIVSYFCHGRIPASRFWAFAFRWNSLRLVAFILVYSVVFIVLFK